MKPNSISRLFQIAVHKATIFFKILYARHKQPLRLEFNITQSCNLNCRGCTHYASLAPREFDSMTLLESNLSHLASVKGIGKVQQLYVIGGEPLLHPQVCEAIQLVRRYFPSVTLKLFTNALLLPRMGSEFWQTLRDTDTVVVITKYPIKFDYEKINELCGEQGVTVELFADRGDEKEFQRFGLDPLKRRNRRLAQFICFNYGCLSVIGDKLFPCSISGCAPMLNARFGTDFRHEDGDYLRVNEIKHVKQIERLRNRPVPFCGYCRKPTPRPYGMSKREASEWVDDVEPSTAICESTEL